MCERLKIDIIKAAKRTGIDPYKDFFQPKDLGLKASDYGSFSDHCDKRTTKSSKYCGCGTLICDGMKPFRYKLKKK